MIASRPPHPWFTSLPSPMVVGHRGAAGHCPENTLTSFGHALTLGAQALELDVHRSADGEVMVIHDRTVNRTTQGDGAVEAMTTAQLQSLDAGYRFTLDEGRTFPFRDRGVRISTLREVLEAFPRTRFVVEIKRDNPQLGDAVIQTLRDTQALDRVLVGSFKDGVLRYMRDREPGLATGAGTRETRQFVLAAYAHASGWLSRPYDALQVPPVYGRWPVITETVMQQAYKNGLHVQVWTINDPDEMRRLIALGVHGITTNYPDRARALTFTGASGTLSP